MFWLQVIYKRRMRAMMVQWYDLAADRRSRRMRLAKAGRHFASQQYIKAWNSWQELVQVRWGLGGQAGAGARAVGCTAQQVLLVDGGTCQALSCLATLLACPGLCILNTRLQLLPWKIQPAFTPITT